MTRAGLGARTNTPYYQSPLIYETLQLLAIAVLGLEFRTAA